MFRRSYLLSAASINAFALILASSAVAQQSLPTIEVGGARSRAPVSSAPGVGRSAQSAPVQPAPAPVRVAQPVEPKEKGYVVQNATSATKTTTPIRETPVSVQVVPKAVLEDQKVTSLDQVITSVSGVQPDFGYGDSWNSYIIRGFSTNDVNQNSSIYRNGIRNFGRAGGLEETSNIERVEIVKGPNSALYGRIEPGGLINIVTRKPQATPHYELEQQFGSFDSYRTIAGLTGPLTADKSVLYRLDGAFQKADSYRNVARGDYTFLAPSLTFRPNDQFEFNVSYEKRDQYGAQDTGVPLLVPGVPRHLWIGTPEDRVRQYKDQINADFTYKFNNDWKVQGGLGSFHGSSRYSSVFPLALTPGSSALDPATGNIPLAPYIGRQSVTAKQGFAQINGHFDTFGVKHDLLTGFDSLQDAIAFRGFTNGFAPITTINIFAPWSAYVPFGYGAYVGLPPDFANTRAEHINGVFVQDQATIMGRLHLMAGMRYDWAYGSFFNIFNPQVEVRNSFKGAHPRFGALFDVTDWLSVYGSYSESLGAVNAGSDTLGRPFKAEEARQSEVGVKADFLDKRLSATLALYELVKTNVLLPAAGQLAAQGFNLSSGEVRSKGVELDIIGKLTDQLSIVANYAHTDALVTKDFNGYAGARMANVARNVFNVWGTYDITDQIKIGTGVFFQGQRPGIFYNPIFLYQGLLNGQPPIINKFDLPGAARWDAMASYNFLYQGYKFTAQMNVYNITDRHYFLPSDTPDGTPFTNILPGAPRSFRASLKVEF